MSAAHRFAEEPRRPAAAAPPTRTPPPPPPTGGISILLLPELPLPTLLSIQLRLGQRVIVSAGSGKDKREASVGLAAHLREGHAYGCERHRAPCRVDWHGEGVASDLLPPGVCPARYYDAGLQAAVYQAIEIEDANGLDRYTGIPVALLPYRLVSFYAAALAARDRFVAEQRAAQARLHSR